MLTWVETKAEQYSPLGRCGEGGAKRAADHGGRRVSRGVPSHRVPLHQRCKCGRHGAQVIARISQLNPTI